MDFEERFASLVTERRNPATMQIDRMETLEALKTFNRLDHEIADAVERVLPVTAKLIDAASSRLKEGGRIIYMGAGTSGRLGVLDASECPPTFGVAPSQFIGLIAGGRDALISAYEGVEDSREEGRKDLERIELTTKDSVIGLAASGRTPYVIGGLEYARSIGALTGSIACVSDSRIGQFADYAIECPIGPEPITGSTRMRSGTAQKLILNMISTELMVKAGKVYENLMVDVQPTNEKLVNRATRIIDMVSGVGLERAADLLRASGNNVKLAICLAVSGESIDVCRAELDDKAGNVAAAIRVL